MHMFSGYSTQLLNSWLDRIFTSKPRRVAAPSAAFRARLIELANRGTQTQAQIQGIFSMLIDTEYPWQIVAAAVTADDTATYPGPITLPAPPPLPAPVAIPTTAFSPPPNTISTTQAGLTAVTAPTLPGQSDSMIKFGLLAAALAGVGFYLWKRK